MDTVDSPAAPALTWWQVLSEVFIITPQSYNDLLNDSRRNALRPWLWLSISALLRALLTSLILVGRYDGEMPTLAADGPLWFFSSWLLILNLLAGLFGLGSLFTAWLMHQVAGGKASGRSFWDFFYIYSALNLPLDVITILLALTNIGLLRLIIAFYIFTLHRSVGVALFGWDKARATGFALSRFVGELGSLCGALLGSF